MARRQLCLILSTFSISLFFFDSSGGVFTHSGKAFFFSTCHCAFVSHISFLAVCVAYISGGASFQVLDSPISAVFMHIYVILAVYNGAQWQDIVGFIRGGKPTENPQRGQHAGMLPRRGIEGYHLQNSKAIFCNFL